MTVLQQFEKIIQDYAGDPGIAVTNESVITAEMGLDSYDLAQVLSIIEMHFNVDIPNRVAMQWQNAGDLIAYIEQNQ